MTSREWMYKMNTVEFYEGIEEFAKQADRFARSQGFTNGKILCPCKKCIHRKWKNPEESKYDLYRYGFVPNYYIWTIHGEERSRWSAQQVSHIEPFDPETKELFELIAREASSSQYTGGSVSIPQYKWLLRQELKREPTAAELFFRTYKKRKTVFVDIDRKTKAAREHYNDEHNSLDTCSGNLFKTYPRGVELVGSKNERAVGGSVSSNDSRGVDHGLKNGRGDDHASSNDKRGVDHGGSKNGRGVDHVILNDGKGANHVSSNGGRVVDLGGAKNERGVDQVSLNNGEGANHVSSNDGGGVNHVSSNDWIGVDTVSSNVGRGVDLGGSKNERGIDHVSSSNGMGDDHVTSNGGRDVDHVSTNNGRVIDHVGKENGTGVDEYASQRINTDEPVIHTSNSQELVHIRKMMERQYVDQELLRAEIDRLRATQLALMQKLDLVMESQSSFQENIRHIVTQEMEKATKILLDVLRRKTPAL